MGKTVQMPKALDLLRQDHGNITMLLRILERQVEEFQAARQPDYDLIRAILDYLLGFPDACHHPIEDLISDKLRDRDPLAADRIGDLRGAHQDLADRAGEFSTGLRAVLEEAEIPRTAFIRLARGFIDQHRQHLDMEESVFFPAVEKTLTGKDWGDLETLLTKMEDASRRFEQLWKTILQWQAEDETVAVQDRDRNRISSGSGLTQHRR